MLESRSAQTNDDRDGSDRAGRCRHRRARAGAERWRLARSPAHDVGSAAAHLAADDAAVPAHHLSALVAADHAGVPADDRAAFLAAVRVGVHSRVPADHGLAHVAAQHPGVPADHLVAAAVLDPDDAADHVGSGPVRSHR